MTDVNTLFCRLTLSQARDEARRLRVKLPKHITALRADRRQFFVEADGTKGEYRVDSFRDGEWQTYGDPWPKPRLNKIEVNEALAKIAAEVRSV